MTGTAFPSSPASRLPSGRHGLARETVVASQRARLIDAMAQVVAEKGYAATTVADVVERAGVSRRTFYEQFADKEACFLAAYDVGLAAVLGRIRETVEVRPAAVWRERARAGVEAFLALLASDALFVGGIVRALHLDVAGPFTALWILAFLLFVASMLLTQAFEGQDTWKTPFLAGLMYVSYTQLWIYVALRGLVTYVTKGGRLAWEKTPRFHD